MGMVCENTYLLKPSERVPGCIMMLAKLLQDAGGPDGTLNIIHRQHDAVNFICNQAGEYICKMLVIMLELCFTFPPTSFTALS